MTRSFSRIIISCTDHPGNVVLCLPVAGFLKQHYPGCEVLFIGKKEVKPILAHCQHISRFIDFSDWSGRPVNDFARFLSGMNAELILHLYSDARVLKAASRAGIPLRPGRGERWQERLHCNSKPAVTRKKSVLHEMLFNFEVLRSVIGEFGIVADEAVGLAGLRSPQKHRHDLVKADDGRFNVIIHPLSGNGDRVWGTDNYAKMIRLLPEQLFQVYVCGSHKDGELFQSLIGLYKGRITDLTGRLSTEEFMTLVAESDAIVATGLFPLQLATALGTHAIGIYPPMDDFGPLRTGVIGKKGHVFSIERKCDDCRKTMDCHCVRSVKPQDVAETLFALARLKLVGDKEQADF